jgi:hypothetical protein
MHPKAESAEMEIEMIENSGIGSSKAQGVSVKYR